MDAGNVLAYIMLLLLWILIPILVLIGLAVSYNAIRSLITIKRWSKDVQRKC